MFWPSTSQNAEYVYKTVEGAFLSADAVLAKYKDWHDVTEWPTSGRTLKKRESQLKKQEDPTTKKGTVGDFCRTYTVEEAMEHFLPGVYTACTVEGRYTYAAGSTAAGAIVYDDGRFLYSNHATDPAGGVLCNAFDLVRLHKFRELDEDATQGTPTVKLPSYLKMLELASNDERVRLLKHRERQEEMKKDFGEYLSEDGEAEEDRWALRLDVDSKGRPSSNIYGGQIRLHVESTDDTSILENMTNQFKPHSGSIVFKKGAEEAKMKELTWENGYITEFTENIDIVGSQPMTITFVVSAQVIKIGGAQFEQNWPK